MLIRFAQLEAERVLGRGFGLCKEATKGRPTRVLLALQSADLCTLSAKRLTNFTHCDAIARQIIATRWSRGCTLLRLRSQGAKVLCRDEDVWWRVRNLKMAPRPSWEVEPQQEVAWFDDERRVKRPPNEEQEGAATVDCFGNVWT